MQLAFLGTELIFYNDSFFFPEGKESLDSQNKTKFLYLFIKFNSVFIRFIFVFEFAMKRF